MDYDDNDIQDQNLDLAGEGSSKVSPVLHSYTLPKFDFDDNLQGHLRFDSLVENEVFLGITSQEDNQWIEEYSRGTSAIPFSSSAAESRHQNVWSEATSSESVEMLLNSVGQDQEEKAVEETIIEEELDAYDKSGSLTSVMDPNIKQCDEKDHVVNNLNAVVEDEFQENFVGSKVSDECEQSHDTFTLQHQETQVDKICDDANEEGSNLVKESFVNELQEDVSVSMVECGVADSSQNVDASIEEFQENPQEVLETLDENVSDFSKNFSTREPERSDKICDDANQEGSHLANESSVNDLQEDPSVSKCGNAGYLQNVDASLDECEKSPQEAPETLDENASDLLGKIHSSEPEDINKMCDDANQEGSKLANELQEDDSVSKVECESGGVSHNVDASVEECQEKPQEASETLKENTSDLSKNFHSSESEHIDMICDNADQEGSNLANESFVNGLQEDPSVFKVKCGSSDSIQNVEASIEECQENPQEIPETCNENATDQPQFLDSPKSIVGSLSTLYHEQGHSVEETEKGVTGDCQQVTCSDSRVSSGHDKFEIGEGSEINNVTTTSIVGKSSAEMPAEDIHTGDLNESSPVKISDLAQAGDEIPSSEPNAEPSLDSRYMDIDVLGASDGQKNVEPSSSDDQKNVKISDETQVGDETQTSEPDAASMHQDFTLNEKGDSRLLMDIRDVDMNVAEVSEPGRAVLTDTDAAVESSKVSSPDTLVDTQLSSETVARADINTEDQPKSPILGVSLLQDNNEEKLEVGSSNEGSFQKGTVEVDSIVSCDLQSPLPSETVVKADIDTENQPISPILGVSLLHDHKEKEEKAEVGFTSEESHQKETPEVDSTVDSVLDVDGSLPEVKKDAVSDVSPSKQTTETLETSPLSCDSSAEETNKAEAGGLLDLKESVMTGEDGAKPFNLAGDLKESVTINISNEQKASASLEKFQVFSFSDTKSIEPSQSAEDNLINPTKGSIENAPLSYTKEEKSFTFEITAQTSIQNLGLSKNMSPFDPNKLHQDSLGSPQTPSEGSKPRRKKETTTTKRSRKDKSTSPASAPLQPNETIDSTTPKPGVIHQPDLNLNNSTSIFHHSFTDYQQVQLRAQILVYGSLISGLAPEEPHMNAAFGQSDNGRRAWEAAWHACVQRVHSQGQKSPVNTPEIKIGSSQNKIFTTPTSPIVTVTPLNPISSPLWNISTPRGPMYRPTVSPLHPYQTPQVQNFSGHNSPWLSPLPSFPRFSPLPITESVKLTTVKEPSGQPSTDSKNRKRKKTAASQTSVLPSQPQTEVVVPSHSPTLLDLSTPVKTSSSVSRDEIMTKIEESKVQAENAAGHAATAVNHCQDVWTQLKIRKSSGLVSDDEAKLASSAVSIAAAASVAKVAAAAAKIAADVAEQARLMADEVLISANENDKSEHGNSTSIISVAKEAARRRIEAASAASKHAENLDAIVKAAELAAEAVSQAGKIVSMGNPLPIQKLIEAGPEGYWKTPKPSEKQKVQTPLNDKDLDKTTSRVSEGPESSKTNVDQNIPESTSSTHFKEGTLVEVYKDDIKKKGAWFAANVLSLKDGKAFVCYTEIQSDEGSDRLKEWVPLEAEDTHAPPKIRVAHPMTTLRFDGSKKRGRTVFSDFSWCSGDQVDVWVHDSWHEAVVVETNKIDVTSLTVQFPGQGKTSIVRSWHVRPTLIWKDKKWVEWSSLNVCGSSEGDTPQEKRQKFEKEKDKQESRIPTLKGSLFDVGKVNKDENKSREGPRVVFGVPKPGKKQKFMDVSKHYVADVSSKNNNTPNHSQGLKNKQAAEIKSKALKFRKPPIPSVVRTLGQKEKSKHSKPSSLDAKDSVRVDESLPDQQKETGFGSNEDNIPLNTPKQSSSTSKGISSRLNKRKFTPGNSKAITKVEVKDKLTSEPEPRRSNRKIQPTSRLLEGLQSSLTVSKMPSVSHASQRSHNKVMSKGSSSNTG